MDNSPELCIFSYLNNFNNCKDGNINLLGGFICPFHLREIFGLEYHSFIYKPAPGKQHGYGHFLIVGTENTIESSTIIFPENKFVDIALEENKNPTAEDLRLNVNPSIQNYVRNLILSQNQNINRMATYQLEILRNMFRKSEHEVQLLDRNENDIKMKNMVHSTISRMMFKVRGSKEYQSFVNNSQVLTYDTGTFVDYKVLEKYPPLMVFILSYCFPGEIQFVIDNFSKWENSNVGYFPGTGIVSSSKMVHTAMLVVMSKILKVEKYANIKCFESPIATGSRNYEVPQDIRDRSYVHQSNTPKGSQLLQFQSLGNCV
jgi:hypothetical protein